MILVVLEMLLGSGARVGKQYRALRVGVCVLSVVPGLTRKFRFSGAACSGNRGVHSQRARRRAVAELGFMHAVCRARRRVMLPTTRGGVPLYLFYAFRLFLRARRLMVLHRAGGRGGDRDRFGVGRGRGPYQ